MSTDVLEILWLFLILLTTKTQPTQPIIAACSYDQLIEASHMGQPGAQ